MSKFKVGDRVVIKAPEDRGENPGWLSDSMLEGEQVVSEVFEDYQGSFYLKSGRGYKYKDSWATLVNPEQEVEEFDIEKVDISWFTDRVKVGEQVARDDKISLLLRDVNRGAKIELTQIRDTSFICGTYWKYAVAERHFDLFVKWIVLQEDIFNQRHLQCTLKRLNEEMQYAKDELDKQSEESEWYNSIPEKGLVCWVSDDVREPDSSCGSAVVTEWGGIPTYPFHTAGESWQYAAPLTEQEIIDIFLPD